MSDIISDTLTRMRNAYLAGKDFVNVQKSNFVINVLNVLKETGFVDEFENLDREIKVTLKYDDHGYPVVRKSKKISKSSRRVYVDLRKIKKLRHGFKVLILSTPKGVMSDMSAIAHGVGGELICEVC